MGIDVGGTKTLIGLFDDQNKLVKEVKFPTAKDYSQFLEDLKQGIEKLNTGPVSAVGIAIPGAIDRSSGVGVRFGNLPWKNVPVKQDVENITKAPVFVENDAKAGGLSEAINVINDFKNVLYIALGTGIGISLIRNGVIDPVYGDRGGNAIEVQKNGETIGWENLASGRAIKQRYDMQASDITDESVWREIVEDLSLGIPALISDVNPDCIIFGGGAGKAFERYGHLLAEKLGPNAPKLLPAKNPERAVIYGCLEICKQNVKK